MTTDTEFDFRTFVSTHRKSIDARLSSYLPEDVPQQLWQAMRYSVLSGGKRIRALLCLAAADSINPSAHELAMPLACAIEMVHAMSLIHDDLPCMDNDDYRRGRPSNHKVFGEAIALLAGDALLAFVFELLVKEMRNRISADVLLQIVEKFAHALGPYGMVAGQAEDLALTGYSTNSYKGSEVRENSTEGQDPMSSFSLVSLPWTKVHEHSKEVVAVEDLLKSMHSKKTGALIAFCAWSGATVAGAAAPLADALMQYGEILGLAFQITDDLLDITGDIKNLGKTPGKDQASLKTTSVSVWGVDHSKKYLMELQNRGQHILAGTGIKTDSLLPLKSLLQYAIERDR